jgi:hypothetical protein
MELKEAYLLQDNAEMEILPQRTRLDQYPQLFVYQCDHSERTWGGSCGSFQHSLL